MLGNLLAELKKDNTPYARRQLIEYFIDKGYTIVFRRPFDILLAKGSFRVLILEFRLNIYDLESKKLDTDRSFNWINKVATN